MSGGIWRKCRSGDISSTLSEITKGHRDLSLSPFFSFFASPLIKNGATAALYKVLKTSRSIESEIAIKMCWKTRLRCINVDKSL